MKRSYALALSAATLFLATSAVSHAQVLRSGQQCQPAVANPSMYGNCHLRIVRGKEVCRCAILPQALRRSGPGDRFDLTTGSINSPRASDVPASGVGGFFESGPRATGSVGISAPSTGSSPTAGSPSAGSRSAGDVASNGSGGKNGNGQGPGNNNGLGNGSEPADNTSSDVKGSDPSNPGGGNGRGGGKGGRGGSGNGNGGGRGGRS